MGKLSYAPDLWTFKLTMVVVLTVLLGLLGTLTRQKLLKERFGRKEPNLPGTAWFKPGYWAQKFQVYSQPNPWLLSPGELTRQRLYYNWLTKGGFVDLGGLVLVVLAFIYLISTGLIYATKWEWGQLLALREATKSWATTTVRVEIAGTVTIGSRRGIIYLANIAEVGEVYALKWLPVRIRVDYVA